jgi:hypothetical protein
MVSERPYPLHRSPLPSARHLRVVPAGYQKLPFGFVTSAKREKIVPFSPARNKSICDKPASIGGMKKTVIYRRVSTIARQQRARRVSCGNIARAEGGITCRSSPAVIERKVQPRRTGCLMREVRKGRIHTVIAYKLDRLGGLCASSSATCW